MANWNNGKKQSQNGRQNSQHKMAGTIAKTDDEAAKKGQNGRQNSQQKMNGRKMDGKNSHKIATEKSRQKMDGKMANTKWTAFLTAQMSVFKVFCGPDLPLAFQFVCGPGGGGVRTQAGTQVGGEGHKKTVQP